MGIATWITTGEEVPVNKKRIVVVDDEEECLKTMRLALVMAGYSVNAFCRADEALDYLLGSFSGSMPFDLLVTDIRMPGMNGDAFIDKVRSSGLAIPVLVITAFRDESLEKALAVLDCREILDKPVPIDVLLRAVRRICEKTQENNAR